MRELLFKIISQIINNTIDKENIRSELKKINPSDIYNQSDLLITDTFISLNHYVSGEEMIKDSEWRYLLNCLQGNEEFCFENKIKQT